MAHWTIKNWNALGMNPLKVGDTITFPHVKGSGKPERNGTVGSMHVEGDASNRAPFADCLETGDETTVRAFASARYGYTASDGSWPCYKTNDMAAATRVVRSLFKCYASGFKLKEPFYTPTQEAAEAARKAGFSDQQIMDRMFVDWSDAERAKALEGVC